MLGLVDEGLDIAKRTYEFYKDDVVPKFKDEAKHFGNFPTMFLSLVSPKGRTGALRRIPADQGLQRQDRGGHGADAASTSRSSARRSSRSRT